MNQAQFLNQAGAMQHTCEATSTKETGLEMWGNSRKCILAENPQLPQTGAASTGTSSRSLFRTDREESEDVAQRGGSATHPK